jgi:transposase InsO family protein
MYMSYSKNPYLPKLRMEAVKLVRLGTSIRAVARHIGVEPSTVSRWVKIAPTDQRMVIATKSSRPHHHPHALTTELIQKVLDYRTEYKRCAFFLHHMLQKDGEDISLVSVKRILKRHQLTYPSKWKKWHTYPERPSPKAPGILVEVDTIHDGPPTHRLYIYTLIDVCSRWAYAEAHPKIGNDVSLSFIDHAATLAPFSFTTIQSDHGSEFSKWLTKRLDESGFSHRHSRIRTPNDNAHLERFNRTIQDECISRTPSSLKAYRSAIPEYLEYYNFDRPHMGLNMQTPMEVLRSY